MTIQNSLGATGQELIEREIEKSLSIAEAYVVNAEFCHDLTTSATG